MDAFAAAQFGDGDFSPHAITMRILSSEGNRHRVACLVLRISSRAGSAERVTPAIAGDRLSALFSSGMFTLPARGGPPEFSGELNVQMCSLTSGSVSHFR